jgi:DNA invertase Pin-like site-specific DNA recombinase
MKKFAYLRISTSEQRPDRQIDGLKGFCDELHIETLSACHKNRPVYEQVVKSLEAGDMLVVGDLDRALRSVVDALTEAERLRLRGVHFKIANLNIDTTTPAGIFVYTCCRPSQNSSGAHCRNGPKKAFMPLGGVASGSADRLA